MTIKEKRIKAKQERYAQYGSTGHRNGPTYSETLLQIHMRNDRKLYDFIHLNKKKLLQMNKIQLVNTLKRNMSSYVRYSDGKNIKPQFVRKSFLDSEIKEHFR